MRNKEKNIGGKREEKEGRKRGKRNGEKGGKKERGRWATGKKRKKHASRWVQIQYTVKIGVLQ